MLKSFGLLVSLLLVSVAPVSASAASDSDKWLCSIYGSAGAYVFFYNAAAKSILNEALFLQETYINDSSKKVFQDDFERAVLIRRQLELRSQAMQFAESVTQAIEPLKETTADPDELNSDPSSLYTELKDLDSFLDTYGKVPPGVTPRFSLNKTSVAVTVNPESTRYGASLNLDDGNDELRTPADFTDALIDVGFGNTRASIMADHLLTSGERVKASLNELASEPSLAEKTKEDAKCESPELIKGIANSGNPGAPGSLDPTGAPSTTGTPANGQLGQNREPASLVPISVSGLSVNYGGDRIGVAADNLFDMISRQYESIFNEGGFIITPIESPESSAQAIN